MLFATYCERALAELGADEPNRVNSTPVKKPEPPKKPDFREIPRPLEEVVRRLESPQLSLDDAMKLFEEGVASPRMPEATGRAEGRVEILLKKATENWPRALRSRARERIVTVANRSIPSPPVPMMLPASFEEDA